MTDTLNPVPREDVLFDIEFALGQHANLWPRHRRTVVDRPYPLLAGEVLKQLELAGVRFFRKAADPAPQFLAPQAGAMTASSCILSGDAPCHAVHDSGRGTQVRVAGPDQALAAASGSRTSAVALLRSLTMRLTLRA